MKEARRFEIFVPQTQESERSPQELSLYIEQLIARLEGHIPKLGKYVNEPNPPIVAEEYISEGGFDGVDENIKFPGHDPRGHKWEMIKILTELDRKMDRYYSATPRNWARVQMAFDEFADIYKSSKPDAIIPALTTFKAKLDELAKTGEK